MPSWPPREEGDEAALPPCPSLSEDDMLGRRRGAGEERALRGVEDAMLA